MSGVNFVTLCHIFTVSRSPYRESLLNSLKQVWLPKCVNLYGICEDPKLIFIQITLTPVGLQRLFANSFVLVFENAVVMVSGSVVNIVRVA